MIALLSLLAITLIIPIFFAGAFAFEVSLAALLLIPLETTLLGKVFGISPTSLISFLFLAGNFIAAYFLLPRQPRLRPTSIVDGFKTYLPQILWAAAFILIYQLCLLWPDFVAMGERLRDFALLSEVIKYPVNPTEPWLPGENLNYYLYWYRLGATFHQLTNLQIFELYHGLQAFTFSLYIAVLYRSLQLLVGTSWFISAAYSFLIAFGSNVAGLMYAINQKGQTWWGPSRVVKGAINEFPAWSFLLGDLHPHFLNLSLLLLFLVWGYQLITAKASSLFVALLIPLYALWTYNANAWEVPVLALLIGFSILLTVLDLPLARIPNFFKELGQSIIFSKITKQTWTLIGCAIVIIISLKITARNISPGSDPVRPVSLPIPLTTTAEIFGHWGFQLTAILVSLFFAQKNWQSRFILLLAYSACLLSYVALPLIILLLFIQITLSVEEQRKASSLDLSALFLNAIGLTALSLLLLPELFFLDDPYGGENERMNTIFKAYSSDWAFLSIYAIVSGKKYLSSLLSDQELQKYIAPVVAIFLAVLTLPFFVHTVSERMISNTAVLPLTQGLSLLDQQNPGAAQTIQAFYQKPDGLTAEAPGNPYSLTSHVCTLSGKQCFLGWRNHVDLLTRKYDESKRREEILDTLYRSVNCDQIKSILQSENIKYVVEGPLEKDRYGTTIYLKNCLVPFVEAGGYRVFNAS